MNITVLDKISFTIGDIDLSYLSSLGNVSYYDVLDRAEVLRVCQNADIIICNKTIFDRELIESLKNLKYLGVTATGYNNIDLSCAKERGIVVTNVPGYSTVDVAQHVFAFILHYSNKVDDYDKSVKEGDWLKSKTFCYFKEPLIELDGKTLGIVGYGDIGKRVAKIADAMGMKVIVYNRSKKEMPYTQVDKETLLRESDFVTLHCPLNDGTYNLINKDTLKLMKPTAVLINTARGPVVNEYDLKDALESGVIAHAMVDVLSVEPMQKECPLIGVKNITFTPHIAWAPKETRQRLIDRVAENISKFINGTPINVVNR